MPKILIIDDDDNLRKAFQVRLEKENFQVFTAESGAEGITTAERENPNLIVLDLAMPDIDGLEVLDQLQKNIVTWEIPVVVLTARSATENRERSRQLGAIRFLQKPFSPRHLISEITRILKEAGSTSQG